MNEQIFSSEAFVVTWDNCQSEATIGARTFKDFHDAKCYATRREYLSGIKIERVRTVIEISKISKKDWYIPVPETDS